MNTKTCAFTGHRPQNLQFGFDEADPRCTRLKRKMQEEIALLIEQNGIEHFISGMAVGVDMYAAEIILHLKQTHPNITLESVIPYETQPQTWSEDLRDRYFDIAAHCDKESMLQTRYTQDCIEKLGQYMVEHSDLLVAVWDGTPSCTARTVDYAHSQSKPVITIHPGTLQMQRL